MRVGAFSVTSECGAGPERDMISLRDGMGSGWDGEFFRRRRRRPRGGEGDFNFNLKSN